MLADWKPEVYSAFTPKVKGKEIKHILLCLNPSAWPDEKLAEKITALGPRLSVQVNPASLL